jgi:hypothetical protein
MIPPQQRWVHGDDYEYLEGEEHDCFGFVALDISGNGSKNSEWVMRR